MTPQEQFLPGRFLPSVLTSTVNLQEPWKSGKVTPPLCKCGRRSKRLTVSNNGPNHGKSSIVVLLGSTKKRENVVVISSGNKHFKRKEQTV